MTWPEGRERGIASRVCERHGMTPHLQHGVEAQGCHQQKSGGRGWPTAARAIGCDKVAWREGGAGARACGTQGDGIGHTCSTGPSLPAKSGSSTCRS